VAKYTDREAKGNEIALGLDLNGGINVTMEVSIQERVRTLAHNPKNENFNQTSINTEQRAKSSQTGYVRLFVEEFQNLLPGTPLAKFFATKDNATHITANSTDVEVERFLERESNNAIENSFQVLRTRIDKFGVASPNIQLQQGTNRIMIELPGVTDEQRVRNLLQGSAKLEFWNTYENMEVYPILENLNTALASTVSQQTPATTDTTAADTTQSDAGLLATLGAGSDTTLSEADPLLALQNPLFNVLQPSTMM